MANHAKWVLSCTKCGTECVYDEIPDDTDNYFFPKKPIVPENFAHKCEACGYRDTYRRTDLRYRDDMIEARIRADIPTCGEGNRSQDNKAFGAAK